ncbi:MAG: Fic family protein [Planctomycetota bacterium]
MLAATRAIAVLEGRALHVVNERLLLGPFWRREARLSSLIEETITTPEKLALAGVDPTSTDGDTREVWNYVRALEHGLNSPLPLSGRLLREMHAILLEGVRGSRDRPGEYRGEQNYIGDGARGFARARFVPPPAGATLERCMSELERFMNADSTGVPALIAVALTHYQFECIHPFRDGNGRLGRLLIVLELCRTKQVTRPWVYVSDYLESNRDVYKDALLAVSQDGEWEAWIRFMLRGFAASADDALHRMDRILALREELRAAVTGPRSSSLMLELIDDLFERPVISVKRACALLDITHTAVRRHLAKLVDLGVIEPLPDIGREQYWIARRILAVSEDAG